MIFKTFANTHMKNQIPKISWRGPFVLVASLLLTACTSSFVYKAAEGPDVSTLTLRNSSGAWIRAMESHKGDCTDMWFFGNDRENINSRATRRTTVAPGTFLVLNIVGGVGMGVGTGAAGSFSVSSCAFNVGFVAEGSVDYEITYSTSSEGCALRAEARTAKGTKPLALTKMHLKNLIGPQSCVRAG